MFFYVKPEVCDGYYIAWLGCRNCFGSATVVFDAGHGLVVSDGKVQADAVVVGPAGLFSMQSLAITIAVDDEEAGAGLEIVAVAASHTDEDHQ